MSHSAAASTSSRIDAIRVPCNLEKMQNAFLVFFWRKRITLDKSPRVGIVATRLAFSEMEILLTARG
jgi:hypothetical protein